MRKDPKKPIFNTFQLKIGFFNSWRRRFLTISGIALCDASRSFSGLLHENLRSLAVGLHDIDAMERIVGHYILRNETVDAVERSSGPAASHVVVDNGAVLVTVVLGFDAIFSIFAPDAVDIFGVFAEIIVLASFESVFKEDGEDILQKKAAPFCRRGLSESFYESGDYFTSTLAPSEPERTM